MKRIYSVLITFACISLLQGGKNIPLAFLERMKQPPPAFITHENRPDPEPIQGQEAEANPSMIFGPVIKMPVFQQTQFSQTTFKQAGFNQAGPAKTVQFKQLDGANNGGATTTPDFDMTAWRSKPLYDSPQRPSRDTYASATDTPEGQPSTEQKAQGVSGATPSLQGSIGAGGDVSVGALMGPGIDTPPEAGNNNPAGTSMMGAGGMMSGGGLMGAGGNVIMGGGGLMGSTLARKDDGDTKQKALLEDEEDNAQRTNEKDPQEDDDPKKTKAVKKASKRRSLKTIAFRRLNDLK